MISKASDIEQKRAIEKTCCLRIPCLKTKAFCEPIAIINESPRKKPVKNEENIRLNYYIKALLELFPLNGRGWFSRYVIDHSGNSANFVHDTI